MKAVKYTVKMEIEVLSIDSVAGIAQEAILKIDSEFPNGQLTADDGDSVKWEVKQEPVEF
jgi:hypothetical protein